MKVMTIEVKEKTVKLTIDCFADKEFSIEQAEDYRNRLTKLIHNAKAMQRHIDKQDYLKEEDLQEKK